MTSGLKKTSLNNRAGSRGWYIGDILGIWGRNKLWPIRKAATANSVKGPGWQSEE